MVGPFKNHVMNGYYYMQKEGYDEDYCNICLTHSYLNNDIVCTAGGVPNPKENPFLTNFIKNHEYTIEEKLINLCDWYINFKKHFSDVLIDDYINYIFTDRSEKKFRKYLFE